MIICIDFDGTIVDHDYPNIGKPVPMALETMETLNFLGHKIILFTMRHGPTLDDAAKYLKDNNIELFGINENPEQHAWSDSRKVYGHHYIDDAAIGCPLIEVKGFKRQCVDWRKIAKHFQIEFTD